MEELISIIVPVYNVEKYIDKCIQSIVNQTYKNIQIIIVDDGSTDSSGLLCDKWKEKDYRIEVVHKKNGGLSYARNVGVEMAKGNFIGFVDSDDYINEEMYSKLYLSIKNNAVDISMCNFAYVDEFSNTINDEKILEDRIFSKDEAFEKLFRDNYWYYVVSWNKLYRKSIFDRIIFPIGKINEDEFIIHHIFNCCNRISTIEDILYFYVQREGSIMSSYFSVKKLDGVYAFIDRYNFFLENKKEDYARKSLRQAYGVLCLCIKNISILENKKLLKESLKEVVKRMKVDFTMIKIIFFFYLKLLCEILHII